MVHLIPTVPAALRSRGSIIGNRTILLGRMSPWKTIVTSLSAQRITSSSVSQILDLPTIQDKERLGQTKQHLRMAVDFAQRNLLHYRLQIPHFYWFARTSADASFLHPAFSYQPVPPLLEARAQIMQELAPSLISFALHFKETGDAESLQACAKLLSHAPVGTIPEAVLEAIPELKYAL